MEDIETALHFSGKCALTLAAGISVIDCLVVVVT